jgi:hypothetical protein
VTMRFCTMSILVGLVLAVAFQFAAADEPGPANSLTTLVCRDRDHPDVGATLVFNLARKRLIDSSGTGGTILFGDGALPVVVTPAAIQWDAGNNNFRLNRATLELDVINRVFFCKIAKNQL